MTCKTCASCNELLENHDNLQLRICLKNVSEVVWQSREIISNPELQRLVDKYTKATDGHIAGNGTS